MVAMVLIIIPLAAPLVVAHCMGLAAPLLLHYTHLAYILNQHKYNPYLLLYEAFHNTKQISLLAL